AFVVNPFSPDAHFDMQAMRSVIPTAVRMLDNVIDISHYPLPQQQERARASRRVGLGVTGMADCLLMLGYGYGNEEGIRFARLTMENLCHTAYRASIQLAREKGRFPLFDPQYYCASPFIQTLPDDIQEN